LSGEQAAVGLSAGGLSGGGLSGGDLSLGHSVRRVVLATRNAHKVAELSRILAASGVGVTLAGLDEFPGAPDVPETGLTFADNALLKARAIAEYTGLPAVADDSGLCVDALHGMPGVLSARWSGKHGDDQANLDLVLGQMEDVTRRGAQFVCAAALVVPASSGTGGGTASGVAPGAASETASGAASEAASGAASEAASERASGSHSGIASGMAGAQTAPPIPEISGMREWTVTGVLAGTLARGRRGANGFGYDPIFVPEGERRTTAEMTPAEKDAISHRGRAFRALAPVIAAALG
jgi:XTP/dITP diphosphohydrolase